MAPALLDAPAAPDLMTVDEFWDFCQLPENQGRSYELVRGKVVLMCRPTHPHGFGCANIARIVGNYSFELGDGYTTSNDAGVILFDDPATVVGPDVAFYRGVKNAAEIPERWGEKVPTLAVEVLSPNDRWSRVQTKIRDYLESGVPLVWLVDPIERSVTVYRPGKRFIIVPTDQVLAGDPELPGFACPVSDFFRLPGEPKAPARS